MAEPTTPATVREWYAEEGWGVLESAETPGGCFAHYSGIVADGYRTLAVGQRVDLRWEEPGFLQDGYRYRATAVFPR
jgi:CspA family cold shock protein